MIQNKKSRSTGFISNNSENEKDETIKELKQELEVRINDNAGMYANLCNALMQIEDANKTIMRVANAMTCNPEDMKSIDPDYCAEQDALDACNAYFLKYPVK